MKAQKAQQQTLLTPNVNQMASNQNASKTGPIAKIKNAKDTLPISKTPKRQKSSRFHITEKVELEKLPNIKGFSHLI
jgi:serine/threonine-protein phosphatase 2A regulatory subunit B'